VSVTPVVHLLNRHRKPGCRSITTVVEVLGVEGRGLGCFVYPPLTARTETAGHGLRRTASQTGLRPNGSKSLVNRRRNLIFTDGAQLPAPTADSPVAHATYAFKSGNDHSHKSPACVLLKTTAAVNGTRRRLAYGTRRAFCCSMVRSRRRQSLSECRAT